MPKSKIAISVDNSLLKLVDSKVDGSVIRSRSQAIEYFLKKGLQEQSVSTAVLLLKGEHQELALKETNGIPLIRQQIEFFASYGIKTVYIVTQHTKNANLILEEKSKARINVEIIEKQAKGNAEALLALKDKVNIKVDVHGGGYSAQADAVRLSIAKGLVKYSNDKKLKETYLNYDRNLLIADVRVAESSKPNDSKPRAKRQKSYR